MSVGLREEALNKKLNEKLAEADLIKKQIETEKNRRSNKVNSIKINIDTSDLDILTTKLEHIKSLYKDIKLLQQKFYLAPTFTTSIINKEGASGGTISASDLKASLNTLGECISKSSQDCVK